jgi:hypothetical protein
MGKLKGTRAALQREMGERGDHAPKLPARVDRKPPVSATQELASELIARFAAGETVRAICASDDRFPTPMTFRTFISRDEALAARWQDALRSHAEQLMEDILEIADNDVTKGPHGMVDTGQVQRDRLRVDVRHLRAAALDPARWGKRTEQVIVGDEARPVALRTTLAPVEVTLGIRALLIANERAMGLLTDESRSDRERLVAITTSGKPVSPALYEILNEDDDQ